MAAKAWHTKAKGQKLDFAGNPKTGWWMEEIQLRLVAEIPLFTTGFIYIYIPGGCFGISSTNGMKQKVLDGEDM